jgi:hypothetical protein
MSRQLETEKIGEAVEQHPSRQRDLEGQKVCIMLIYKFRVLI